MGFPVRRTWPIIAGKWPNCVCTLFVFLTVICPRVSIIMPLCTNVWHAQVLICEIRELILLCVGVMSVNRTWALVWKKNRRLQCVFSLWPPLDLSGRRLCAEAVIQDQNYVTLCRWQDLGVNWELAPTASARETLALKLLVASIGLNDTDNSVSYLRWHSFPQLPWCSHQNTSMFQCNRVTMC